MRHVLIGGLTAGVCFLVYLTLCSLVRVFRQLMSVDSNDVPLLLSAAAVLCPEVGTKYGISVR